MPASCAATLPTARGAMSARRRRTLSPADRKSHEQREYRKRSARAGMPRFSAAPMRRRPDRLPAGSTEARRHATSISPTRGPSSRSAPTAGQRDRRPLQPAPPPPDRRAPRRSMPPPHRRIHDRPRYSMPLARYPDTRAAAGRSDGGPPSLRRASRLRVATATCPASCGYAPACRRSCARGPTRVSSPTPRGRRCRRANRASSRRSPSSPGRHRSPSRSRAAAS